MTNATNQLYSASYRPLNFPQYVIPTLAQDSRKATYDDQPFRHMASKGLFSSFLSIVPENDICQGCQAKQLLASLTSSKFTALSGTRPARVSLRSTDDAKETRNNHRGLIGTITVVTHISWKGTEGADVGI
jgi:hypothetical protein